MVHVILSNVLADSHSDPVTSKNIYFDQLMAKQIQSYQHKVPDVLHCPVDRIDLLCLAVCSYSTVRFKINGVFKKKQKNITNK